MRDLGGLARTDRLLDELGARSRTSFQDGDVTAALAAWAHRVDPAPSAARRRGRWRLGRAVVGGGLALATLMGSSVAAAVTDSDLGPLTDVGRVVVAWMPDAIEPDLDMQSDGSSPEATLDGVGPVGPVGPGGPTARGGRPATAPGAEPVDGPRQDTDEPSRAGAGAEDDASPGEPTASARPIPGSPGHALPPAAVDRATAAVSGMGTPATPGPPASNPAASGTPASKPAASGTPASNPAAPGPPASSPTTPGPPASSPTTPGSPAQTPSATLPQPGPSATGAPPAGTPAPEASRHGGSSTPPGAPPAEDHGRAAPARPAHAEPPPAGNGLAVSPGSGPGGPTGSGVPEQP